MKKHEAWYEEYTARVEPQIDYLDTQVSWRAALEWVLEECECDGWGGSLALDRNKIEKELKS